MTNLCFQKTILPVQKELQKQQCKKDKGRHSKILLPRVKKSLPAKVQKMFRSDLRLLVNPTGKFVSAVLTEIPASPAARSSSTHTAVTVHMAAAHSQARTHRKSTGRQHTLHAILPRTLWQQECATGR